MDTSETEPIPLVDAIAEVITRLTGEAPDPEKAARIAAESQSDTLRPAGLTDDQRIALDSIRISLDNEER